MLLLGVVVGDEQMVWDNEDSFFEESPIMFGYHPDEVFDFSWHLLGL